MGFFPVEQAMDHNQERQTTSRENRARTHVLSKEVQHLQEEKSRQVGTALPLTLSLTPAAWTQGPPWSPCPGHLPFPWTLELLWVANTQAPGAAFWSELLFLDGWAGGPPCVGAPSPS